jgi:hypothetical protein
MYLVDTNVWSELLLEQEKAERVCRFLAATEGRLLWITEFSLYSIGIILTRLKKDNLFEDFLSDALEDSGVVKVRLETPELKQLLAIRRKFHLDFDDAYQYAIAEKYALTVVSFDADFDRTRRGRKTPVELLS